MNRIYLDYNATTPVDPRVLESMIAYHHTIFGNASSIHWYGQCAKKAIEDAREKVAAFIKAKPSEVVFTGSGTEADNLALFGIANLYREGKRRKIIISAVEHHAVLNAANELKRSGFQVVRIPVNTDGIIIMDKLYELLDDSVLMVSVMMANNETGVVQPVEAIGKIANERGIIFHTDAVQAAGKISIDVESIGCSLLSLSAHKMYGPKGVGALYVNQRLRVYPILFGGGQERGRRAGTENIAGIVGFGKACELCMDEYTERDRIRYLRDRLESYLLNNVKGAVVHGKNVARVPNTISISFIGVDAEALVIDLDLNKVAVSTGAACSSGSIEPSHVLAAMSLPKNQLSSTIRISIGRFTTEEEINDAAQIISSSVEKIKQQLSQAVD